MIKIKCQCPCHQPGSHLAHMTPCCVGGYVEVPDLEGGFYPERPTSETDQPVPEDVNVNDPETTDERTQRKLAEWYLKQLRECQTCLANAYTERDAIKQAFDEQTKELEKLRNEIVK